EVAEPATVAGDALDGRVQLEKRPVLPWKAVARDGARAQANDRRTACTGAAADALEHAAKRPRLVVIAGRTQPPRRLQALSAVRDAPVVQHVKHVARLAQGLRRHAKLSEEVALASKG